MERFDDALTLPSPFLLSTSPIFFFFLYSSPRVQPVL